MNDYLESVRGGEDAKVDAMLTTATCGLCHKDVEIECDMRGITIKPCSSCFPPEDYDQGETGNGDSGDA